MMRQNFKCIKDILIFVQDNVTLSNPYIDLEDFFQELNKYTRDEIIYSLRLLEQQNLFTVFVMDDLNLVGRFGDLNFQGHAVAEAARNDTFWNKAIEIGKHCLPDIIKFILLA